MITQAMEPLVTRVLPRGNWQDESGEVVDAGRSRVPQPAEPSEAERRLTRLDLARWIVAPENPLTARVFMNRLWKQFFGNGLSGVLDDVGAQGEWPTHPELLDWLAVEFREQRLGRQADGQAAGDVGDLPAGITAAARAARDRPRATACSLSSRRAGSRPSSSATTPWRSRGCSTARSAARAPTPTSPPATTRTCSSPTATTVADRDDRQYRRGVYMHWQRTFLHPMLANFDAPSREECTAVRTVANTPAAGPDAAQRPHVRRGGTGAGRDAPGAALGLRRRAAGRTLSAGTCAAGPRGGTDRRSWPSSTRSAGPTRTPEDAAKLLKVGFAPAGGRRPPAEEVEAAAWTSVCRVVLNLQETITRY